MSKPSSAKMHFSTRDLEAIVSEWLQKKAGVEGPVQHDCVWKWVPNVGPLLDITVSHVANVLPFPTRPKKQRSPLDPIPPSPTRPPRGA